MQGTKKPKVSSLTAMTGKFEESLNLSTASNEFTETQSPGKGSPPTPSVIPQYVHQISSSARSPRSSSEGVQRSGELSREVSGDYKRSSKSGSGNIGGLGAPQASDPQTVAAI